MTVTTTTTNEEGPLVRSVSCLGSTGTLLGIIVSYHLIQIVYNLTLHPLAKYPGPKVAAITRFWHVYHLVSGTAVETLLEMHQKYGPVVRIAPNEVTFTSRQAWNDIFGSRHGKPEMSKDAPMYQNPAALETITTAPPELHRLYRRLLSRGFSETALKEQEYILRKHVELLMRKLRVEASVGGAPEMTSWFNFTTFDIIGELVFEESFGCLENSYYHSWVNSILEAIKFGNINQALAYYPYLDRRIVGFITRSLSDNASANVKLIHEKVQQLLEKPDSHKGLVSGLFSREYDLTTAHIEGNCATVLVGGSVTTATALSAATYYLARNPEAKAKVVGEVRECFFTLDDINAISTNKLRYMKACLNEAFRKFPPAPELFSRRVPKGGAFIDKSWVPEGMLVGISIFCANNTRHNFRDPDKFTPERWMGDSAHQDDTLQAMQVFSYGPRNCIGQNLANMIVRLVLARFIWEFDWELDDSLSTGQWDNTPIYQIWDKKPLRVRLRRVAR